MGAAGLRGQVHVVGLAGHDDGLRQRAVEGAGLAAIAGGPRRVLVAQSDVERETAGDFDVVLHEDLPGGVGAAEGIGGEAAAGVRGQPEHPVGKGVAGARGVRRVLGVLSVERPVAHIVLAVRPEPLVVAHLDAGLDHVPALDPGEVVGELQRVAVLRFGPLVERGAVEAGVTGPGEVGERSGIERAPQIFQAGDAGLLVEVGARQVGRKFDERRTAC